MPTTFNTDNCSLGLVHYADNSHHSCRGHTFEKNLFVWRLCQQRWQRRFLEIRLKRHNFACVYDKQIVSSCVERIKNYAVILKEFGCFMQCAKFEQA